MIIDLLIGMSVLGIVSFFAWSIGYTIGYLRGMEDHDEIYEISGKDE